MQHYLVQFVEDALYHVCPTNHVRHDSQEVGLVSAKYKGIFFRAIIVSEGEKSAMVELKERCITNDRIKEKYKFRSPSPSNTASTSTSTFVDISSARRNLFPSPTLTKSDHSDVVPDVFEFEERNITQKVAASSEHEAIELCKPTEGNKPMEAMESLATVSEEEVCDEENEKGKVVKKYYCPYCRGLYRKFARHILQVHSGEKEIEAIIGLEKKNPQRRRVLDGLRAKGSKIFNALTTSPSEVIIPRRKRIFKKSDYTQCNMCGNLYKSYYLTKHIKKCPKNDGSIQTSLRIAKALSLTTDEEEQQPIQYSEVIANMREGNIKMAIQNDPLLVQFGKHLCRSYGKDVHLINLIRRKLRQLAELLLAIKEIDNDVVEFTSIFQPKKKNMLFNAIRKITGYSKGEFKRASLANELSTLLEQLAMRYLNTLQEADHPDEEKIVQVKRWLEIIKSEYNAIIGKHARKTLEEIQWNRPKTLPLAADVVVLNKYVQGIVKNATDILTKEFSYPNWALLNKGSMVRILLFNKKRVGDIQRLKIGEFEKAHTIQKGSATYQLLSESEKLHCKLYKRVETRGKRGRAVPILLTNEMLRNVKLIIAMRNLAGIPQTNPYVFAQKGDKPFCTSTVMKELAFDCGAKSPELLTGTRLRKEIATITQAFNFSTNDLSILAKFLGHTLETHSNFYRLPDEAIQLAKISVVLQAIDSGKINELKGKSLDELEEIVKRIIEEADRTEVLQDEVHAPTTSSGGESSPRKARLVKIIRKTWTTPQKQCMRKHFLTYLETKTLPSPAECNEARNRYTPLKSRSLAQIKAWVNNENIRSGGKKKFT